MGFDNLLCMCLGISLTVWFTLLLVFIIVPAILDVSFGIRKIYMNALLKVFEWATLRMQRGAKEKNQHLHKPYSNGIIAKEPSSLEQELRGANLGSEPEFEMADIFYFCRRGAESIMDDEVTKRFTDQELESWNLLTRNNYNFRRHSLRLSALWGFGVLIRYGFLLPIRVTLAVTGIGLLVVLTSIVGLLPSGELRSYLSEKVHLMCYRICVRALTAIITYHHSENKPKNGGICVANHTTPIDVIILANDGYYSMVGQVHGGLIGVVQRAMVKSTPHIWFERSEVKDRHLVAKRLSDHVSDKSKQPILIFPEGTCINNTSVMMFKKGSFEIGCTVYPVAIKYDPRFGDAFWNSSKFGMVNYLLRMMSSWAIVCSVWYLPPMNRQEGEDAVQFANRVKAAIARQGGLQDLLWDGGLKRGKVKDTFKEEQQKLYSKVLVGEQDEEDCTEKEGMEREGIEKEGMQREGIENEGMQREWKEKEGMQREGIEKEGMESEGIEKEGVEREGIEKEGVEREGIEKKGVEREGIEKEGMQREGIEREGMERQGIEREQKVRGGIEEEGTHGGCPEKEGVEREGIEKVERQKEGKQEEDILKHEMKTEEIEEVGTQEEGTDGEGTNMEGTKTGKGDDVKKTEDETKQGNNVLDSPIDGGTQDEGTWEEQLQEEPIQEGQLWGKQEEQRGEGREAGGEEERSEVTGSEVTERKNTGSPIEEECELYI